MTSAAAVDVEVGGAIDEAEMAMRMVRRASAHALPQPANVGRDPTSEIEARDKAQVFSRPCVVHHAEIIGAHAQVVKPGTDLDARLRDGDTHGVGEIMKCGANVA